MSSLELPAGAGAERAVLGAILASGESYHRAADILRAEDFWDPRHRATFEAFEALASEGTPVDLLTTDAKLSQLGSHDLAGGLTYLTTLADELPDPANIEHYAVIVRDASERRSIIRIAQETAGHAASKEWAAADVLDEATRELLVVATRARKARNLAEVVTETVVAIEERATKPPEKQDRLSTGIPQLDGILLGIDRHDLVLLAARPGVGKTSLALDIAYNVSTAGHGVFFASLEMSASSLGERLLSSVASIPSQYLRAGRLAPDEWQTLALARDELAELPIHIDDDAGQTVARIRARARAQQMRSGLGLVVVDYLQLLTEPGARRGATGNEIVGAISRGLKAMAKQLGVPVLALSQLSRPGKGDPEDRTPRLTDLRDSGSLEQDADIVVFLSRRASEKAAETKLVVAKHRNGPVGDALLVYQGQYTTFREAMGRLA